MDRHVITEGSTVIGPISRACSLIDQDGRRVASVHSPGVFTLLVFGFTHCRVVCPRVLGTLTRVLSRMGPTADLMRPTYVTVDPERDTPDRMKTFLTECFPRFTGLTGTADELLRVRQAFRVFAAPQPAREGAYDIAHTAMAYLLDRKGALIDHWPESLAEDAIVLRLSRWVNESRCAENLAKDGCGHEVKH